MENHPLILTHLLLTPSKHLRSSPGTTISNIMFRNCTNTSLIINSTSLTDPVRIINCIFADNSGTWGGAIRVEAGASVVISDTKFIGE